MEANNERFDLNIAAVRRMGWLALFLSVSEGVHGFAGVIQSSQASIARTPRNTNSVSIYISPHRDSCSTVKPHRRNSFFPKLQFQSVDNMDGGSSVCEQDLVDDYLEFLDRRYHRFNDNNDGAIRFSALKWLKQGKEITEKDDRVEKVEKDERSKTVPLEVREEDALYVLGVAGLASQKLLHKHKLVPCEDKKIGRAQPAETELTAHMANAKPTESKLVSFAAPFVALLRRMEGKRCLFLRYKKNKIDAFVTFMRNNLISLLSTTIQVSEKLWDASGGRRALQYTLTACATAVLILQPLLRIILLRSVRNSR